MEANGTVAWEGRFGDADLTVQVPPNGRIHAEWTTNSGTRQKVVDSIDQLERSVLFQLMVGGDVDDEIREEVADAVAITLANRTPLPREEADPKKKSTRKRQNRGRGGPRRRGNFRPRRRR